MVLVFAERSPSLLVINYLFLTLFCTVILFFHIKCRLLGHGKGLLITSAGSVPDYASVCILEFFCVSEVEAPLLSLSLIPCLTPSVDVIHESFSNFPGVLAAFLNLGCFAIEHNQ